MENRLFYFLKGRKDLSGMGAYTPFFIFISAGFISPAGTKKSAVEAFKQELETDPNDPYLLNEMRKTGIRRKPVLAFLKRFNPINEYIGMLLHNKAI